MYLIVPAVTDLAGRCNIVFCEGFTGNALADYRQNPDKWSTVGHMNSRGELITLDAPANIYREFKGLEPLMAGIQIRKLDLELAAFTSRLANTHPAKILLESQNSVPFTLLHKDVDAATHISYCTHTGIDPIKEDDDHYRMVILMHRPNKVSAKLASLLVSKDGACELLNDDGRPLVARPLLVGELTALTKEQLRYNARTELEGKIGRIWWVANSEDELSTELDRLSRAGAHICSVHREDDRDVIDYSFALNKDHAKVIMLYEPDQQEWLDNDEGGILAFLEKSLDLESVVPEKEAPSPMRDRA